MSWENVEIVRRLLRKLLVDDLDPPLARVARSWEGCEGDTGESGPMREWRCKRRTLGPLGLVVVGALALVAVPTALAAKPIRTVFEPQPLVIPAGFGCSFDVGGQPGEGARATLTEFSDGRTVIQGHAEPTLTNLETGETFAQRTRAKITDTFDPQTNEIVEEVSGRIFINLYPGDQGPSGLVEEPGAVLSVIGHQRLTFDPDTFVVSSYSLNGKATDICAQLSG